MTLLVTATSSTFSNTCERMIGRGALPKTIRVDVNPNAERKLIVKLNDAKFYDYPMPSTLDHRYTGVGVPDRLADQLFHKYNGIMAGAEYEVLFNKQYTNEERYCLNLFISANRYGFVGLTESEYSMLMANRGLLARLQVAASSNAIDDYDD